MDTGLVRVQHSRGIARVYARSTQEKKEVLTWTSLCQVTEIRPGDQECFWSNGQRVAELSAAVVSQKYLEDVFGGRQDLRTLPQGL